MSVQTMVIDPEFLRLSPAHQQQAVAALDPDAAKLSPADFQTAVKEIQKSAISNPASAPGVAKPQQPNMQTSALGSAYDAVTNDGTPSGQSQNATGGTVIVPKPGESFQDTMARGAQAGKQYINPAGDLNDKGQQMVNTEGAQGGAPGVGVGFGKGVLETGHTAMAAAGKLLPDSIDKSVGLPTSFQQPDYLQSTNTEQSVGKGLEGVAEFMLGDAAAKGVGAAAKASHFQTVAKVAQFLGEYPRLLNIARTAMLGGVQGGVHEGTTEGIKTGVEAGLAGGALGEVADLAGARLGKYAEAVSDKVQQLAPVKAALKAVSKVQESAHDEIFTADQQFGKGVIPESFDEWKDALKNEDTDVISATRDAIKHLPGDVQDKFSGLLNKGTENLSQALQPVVGKLAGAAGKAAVYDLTAHAVHHFLFPNMPDWVPAAAGLYGGASSLMKIPGSPEGLKFQKSVLTKAAPLIDSALPAASTGVRAAVTQGRGAAKNVNKVASEIGKGNVTHIFNPDTGEAEELK